ncbi:hypothetical protein GCM10010994_50050 [Chelatococcus reniformis]|uniref:Uncharacterized protein n=1 Tax=Chelatococcus reniformis TaxID=1494448 RepID=A0A916USV2_9HYPH|nr:hypothetical protein GCM10010994_50050 [Chelatococcus reniformis]
MRAGLDYVHADGPTGPIGINAIKSKGWEHDVVNEPLIVFCASRSGSGVARSRWAGPSRCAGRASEACAARIGPQCLADNRICGRQTCAGRSRGEAPRPAGGRSARMILRRGVILRLVLTMR